MGMYTCEECLNYDDPKTDFAHIMIHIAAQVVFNELEGKHATCYLFYDTGRILEDCDGVVVLSGMSGVWSDAEINVCTNVTRDRKVIHRVGRALNK